MKRLFCVIAALLLLFTFGVSAASDTQQITLTENADGTFTFIAKKAATIWETPALSAGEVRTSAGLLTILNGTNSTQTIRLSSVLFPYEDPEVLEYLNHIQLTVRKGSTVLYDGKYSDINNTQDPVIHTELEAGDALNFTIDMRCDYTYTGTRFSGDHLLEWQFTNVPLQTEDEEEIETPSFFSDTLVLQWAIAAVLTIIAVWLIRRRTY